MTAFSSEFRPARVLFLQNCHMRSRIVPLCRIFEPAESSSGGVNYWPVSGITNTYVAPTIATFVH